MSQSLQDQLVSLGLAKEEQARKKPAGKPRGKGQVAKGKGKGAGRRGKGKGAPAGPDGISLEQAYRIKAREEKAEQERSRQRKRAEDLKRQKLNQEIRPIVEAHAVNDPEAELKRNFLYKGRIRSVAVNADQLRAVNAGELGIVYLTGRYFLLPPEHVAKVREISDEHVPDLGGDEPEDEEFPVPDDLIW